MEHTPDDRHSGECRIDIATSAPELALHPPLFKWDKIFFVSLSVVIWLGACIFLFFTNPFNPPLLYAVFPAFFRELFAMDFRLPDSFWMNLSCELFSLLLHGAIGVLFLRLFLRLPRSIEWIAGIFVGIGLATFILEFWAIAFLLNPGTILISLLALIGLFGFLKKKIGWSSREEVAAIPSVPSGGLRGVYHCSWGILIFITLLSFYHALLYPVDYWDALILYVHYGKLTYLQGGFPVLVCLQVGLGLGANYPHLYPLHQAVTATLFGHWSDLYGQLLPPLAGLGSMLILYVLALRLFRDRLIAVLSVMVFRSVPFVTTYFIWASDYSLVMLYTTLFLYFLECFLSKPSIRMLFPLLAVSAIFPHINYLGWIVWPPLALAILWRWRELSQGISFTWLRIAGVFLFWFVMGLTWYVRNWIVTGNPVYAFFPQIFGGRNINLDILASCNREWTAHGVGAAAFGKTLWTRILNSFFLNQYESFLSNWRFAPMLMGVMFPAFLLGWRKKEPFFWMSAFLLGLYFVYQYIISGLYWYHTIAVFPILAIYVARLLSRTRGHWLTFGYGFLMIIAAVVPGVSYSIVGPKMSQLDLPIFATPGMTPEEFYHYKYPKESPVWRYINRNLEKNAIILSHDNRYHVYRDDIQIIHLDDCGLTPLYGKPYPEIHQELLKRGIRYYLYIPDENDHPVVKQLGLWSYLENPHYYEKIISSGTLPDAVQLYRLLENGKTPAGPTQGSL